MFTALPQLQASFEVVREMSMQKNPLENTSCRFQSQQTGWIGKMR